MNSRTRRIVWLLVGFKFSLILFVCAVSHFSPKAFQLGRYIGNFHLTETLTPSLAERFSTWDSQHYIAISRIGYEKGAMRSAFYPLWPLFIKVGGWLTFGHDYLAAVLLSNLISLAAWVLFHRLVARKYGELSADTATLFLVTYPGALFFTFPYSESLFLFWVVVLFWGFERDNLKLQLLAGFCLPMTRAIGLLCLLPFLIHHFEKRSAWRRWVIGVLAILGGYGTYLLTMLITTGNAFEGFAAQKLFICNGSIMKIFNIPGFVHSFFAMKSEIGYLTSPLDRFFFLFFLLTLPMIYRLNKTYFGYALIAGILPAFTQSFMSYTRFLSVVFPFFVALDQTLLVSRKKTVRWLFAVSFLFGQMMLLYRQMNNDWVG